MFNEAQKQVDEWVKQFKIEYFILERQHVILTEEVGELAREISHDIGSKKKKAGEKESSIEDELADILFVIICMANREGIDLDQAFKKTMDKKYSRDNDRFERKDSEK